MKSRFLPFGLVAASPLLLTVCASTTPNLAPAPAGSSSRALGASSPRQDAIHGALLRNPDVSATHVVFSYADDLWIVPREGGQAAPLASPAGVETMPRFSPDGRTVAFMANYDGNTDLYTVPAAGGIPERVTHHPFPEVLCGWTPAGELLYFTSGHVGRTRISELYTVAPSGGLPTRVAVPYGAWADLAPAANGEQWLAYTPHTRDHRSWKRYRGGMSTNIWLYDLASGRSKQATEWEGTDSVPMWHGGQLYYVSDDGPQHRINLWKVDPATLARTQLTTYEDFDVRMPAMGPGPDGGGEIVFQVGSDLVLYDVPTGQTRTVDVTIPGARSTLRPRTVDASDFVDAWDLSPTGKRLAVSARGEVWSLPAKEGSVRNLTRTDGVGERDGTFSPDGKWVAYLSDESGEYEVVVASTDGRGAPRTLTSGGQAFRRLMSFTPDSKQIVFCDKTGSIYRVAVEGGEAVLVDRDTWAGDLIGENPSFTHDSRWMAYGTSDPDSGVGRIALYDLESGQKHLVTSGMFDDSRPCFDRAGDHLYFRRRGHFSPLYGEIDQSFLYAGTEQLLVVPLRADQASPFAPKSDEEEAKAEEDEAEGEKKADAEGEEKKNEDDEDESSKKVEIDLEGFEARAVLLPIDPGNFSGMHVNDDDALLYIRHGYQGSDMEPALKIFDAGADEPEEKTVAEGVRGFTISADGKVLLVFKGRRPHVGPATAGSDLEAVSTDGMEMSVDPRAEWRQIVHDAWRLMRDFFYDPNMHGVDWKAVYDRYQPVLADCGSRDDVSYVIREMIAELNVGHAYYFGGDTEDTPSRSVGMLGCDYTLENGAYRIARILEGAPWDADARGPLSQPGVDVKEGDYLLAVNGQPVDPARSPWAAFQGLGGKTVTLTVSVKPTLDDEAREVVVEALSNEVEVRYRAWIEGHRRLVEERTGGRVGYIYVPSTGIDGQNDLVRQFQGQLRKEALIIDERWNSGGQIPTRFIEMLNRPVTNYWARRDGHDWPWPPDAHFGPKCMLINGLSGSGGDAFPWYFRQAGLGKLIGTRTWGGLVGLSGYPTLIDGGDIECPSFAFYEQDGTWGVEGHGVDPDIEVLDDPALMKDGADPQLDRAIALMLEELQTRPYVAPKRPPYPDRSGMGLPPKDH
jgi:tricorn protease